MAEFVSRSLDNLSNGLQVRDGMKYLGLRDNRDLLPGMEVRLIPHQIIGVTWMLTQERESPYKGGILADEMGLGKTVQMIATMAMNPPSEDDKNKTTLIVVPAALLHQWKEELEAKTNGIFSVHVHHGKEKLKTLSAMKSKDVIITTYQSLNLEFSIKDDCADSAEEDAWLEQYGGLMAKMKWYRVILDEAQFVRNRNTRSSKTVAMLKAKYRWMLTGTPITNSLADLYGLIRFGRFRPWNDWESFDGHIAKVQIEDSVLAGMRAQEILKPILLRRTKDAKLEGEPILKLPNKYIELKTMQFSEDERQIYDNFEKRAKIQIGKFIKENTILKNHAAVLVMILRLRQLCCHPYLILSQAEGFEDPSVMMGSEADKEFARAKRLKGGAWCADVNEETVRFSVRCLQRARAMQLDFTDDDDDDFACPVCHDLFVANNGRVLGCGHEICADCRADLAESAIAHDGVFGTGNEKENMNREKQIEAAELKGLRPCPTCHEFQDLRPNAVFMSSAFDPTDQELKEFANTSGNGLKADGTLAALSDSEDEFPDLGAILKKETVKKGKGKVNAKAKGKAGADSAPKSTIRAAPRRRRRGYADGTPDQQMLTAWGKGDDDLEPSAKMLALIEELRVAEREGDKTIVYSQWTSMLDLIEMLFGRYGIQNLRYDGKMSREAREKSLGIFKKMGGPKVILISTKCGGVGLNLVSANRVINMDLSWNYAAESQAYDRVHRLGQEKEVFVKRLVVSNTIEERMLRLQDVKVGLSDVALGEGNGMKLHKMSVKEIKAVSHIPIV
ncbi:uncharacterized protein STEHIDRAFT_61302 [Stereum hirsutum FP-91666 SS1]|uniref:uncharacterized protein n=1 Tax=Stereum hirsutum (strain FP-91666) TaxID=721885 RepID=UPI000444950C|nr:uncharacterized protein STEHIDRAFT_61302 [Stereum hirsutum FP-91666 SS1]EIM84514.1 hypothetical protein STEHIDRAFT_61302 [Stereum hirsutum FP-91666 SS1]